MFSRVFELETPYRPLGKCIFGIDDALAGGIAAGLGSLASGIFGSGSQRSANEANLQIARETNAQNYKMFQEQLGFNERMYHENNMYNSPSAQVERFKQAGLNPYLMMSEGANAGNADAVSAPAANPAVTGAPMQPVWQDRGQIGDLLDSIGKAVDLKTKNRKNLADIKQAEASGALSDAEARKAIGDNRRADALLDPTIKQLNSQIGLNNEESLLKREQAILARMQSKLAEFDLKNIRPAELARLNNEIDLLSSEYDLNYSKIDEIASVIARNFAEANKLKVEASQMDYLTEFIADELQSREELNYYNSTPHYESNNRLKFGNSHVGEIEFNDRQDSRFYQYLEGTGRHARKKMRNYRQKRKIQYGGHR